MATFTGTAGHEITLSIVDITMNEWVGLFAPDGTLLSGWHGSPICPLILPEDGLYSIRVNPAGATTGTVELTLRRTG